MNPLFIALRNLTARPLLTLVAALIIGLGVGLTITILVLTNALQDGLVRASRPFDLLVGAKGSPNQLVMSTILLQDAPVGNISLDYFETLRADPRVTHAFPVAMGDNAFGAPILGVTADLQTLADPATGIPYFELSEGEWFEEQGLDHEEHIEQDEHAGEDEHAEEEEHEPEEWQAVIGARVPVDFAVGTTFQSAHGTTAQTTTERHDAFFTVVGRLKPSDTPWDRAILVPLESYWHVHEGQLEDPGVTAVMVRPVGVREFYQLHQEINADTVAQAVLTGQGMATLFDQIDLGTSVLLSVAYLTLLMSAATVFLVSLTTGAQRQRESAVMRALGANRFTVLMVGMLEPLLLGILGIALGALFGHLAAWLIAGQIETSSALAIHATFIPAELFIYAAMLLLIAAAGLVPSLALYRQDVTSRLSAV